MNASGFLCVCLLTLAGAGCSISVLPPYRVHDGYDGMSITGAELGEVLESEHIVELKKFQISGMIRRSPYTWILIAAPWCPYAIQDWKKISEADSVLSALGVSTVIVFADYRKRFISCRKIRNGYQKDVFILSNTDYGDSTWSKTESFLQELGVASDAIEKYPIHLLFDNEQKLLYSVTGTVKDPVDVVRWLESDGDLRLGIRRP